MIDIIHRLDNANFTGYMYTYIFVTETATVVLNGTSVPLDPALGVINIKVKNCTSATPANVFLMGGPMPPQGVRNIDIKTGLPLLTS